MLPSTKARVRERAGNACEYCHLHQDNSPLAVLHIEHIIPKIHGGTDNLHKGPNLTGIDPATGTVTELFHPRNHNWEDHFGWDGIYIISNTAIGRTTIRVLNMNSEDQLALRSS
jgi:hypothetical protein